MANLGSITINEMEVLEIDASPKTSGVDAAVGSLAVLTNGTSVFLKTGEASTNWASVGIEYTYVVTNANQTSTSTTHANVTELITESIPIGTYIFECYMVCQSTNVNSGIGFRIGSVTATIGSVFGHWQISQAADGTGKVYQYDQSATTTNITSVSVQAVNTNFVAVGRGIVTTTATGGIAVQFRSETTTAVSVRIGSLFYLKKVA